MANTYTYAPIPASTQWLEKAAAIGREIAAPAATDVDEKARFPKETLAALGEQGFFGLCLPKEVGGAGEAPRTFAAVVEELSQYCGSSAMVYVMHVVASQTLVVSTQFAEKTKVLKEMAAGKHLTTLAFSEKGSRSQFWMPCSKLQAQGDAYSTTAEKSWVTSAEHAQSYVSSALSPTAGSPMESTLYLVDRTAKGVQTVAPFNGLGLRGNESAPVKMNNVTVGSGDLLSENGKGAEMMLQVVLPWFVVGTSAMAHGLCRAAIGATASHLTTAGYDSGSKLRDLPNLRARLARMNMLTERSRALLGLTVAMMEQPTAETPLYVLQSRLSAMETAVEVTDLAMKACGGAAFSKHLGIERCFRDARAGWVMAPTVDHLQEFVGRALTGMELF
ncbi:MAG: acyl-CoA/acyl-ACP dehydrogenase [Bdellovibrionales bacterium]|nr:acyl-CoA/acyl-ACP dehydrogenase [Bdellovibrionales bacterium]